MVSNKNRSTPRIALLAPVLVMLLAAIAIPLELQPQGHFTLAFNAIDVVENVVGFVPVGFVLGGLGPVRAVLVAAGISMLAEISQLFMVDRNSSAIDVATNITGALLGALINSRWRIGSPSLQVNKWIAIAAAAMALAFVFAAWADSIDALITSPHGSTSPGTLEAYWKFDESGGGVLLDSSGHGLNGWLLADPQRVAGVRGGALLLDGKRDSIDFGNSTAFRFTGSMTISAWIHPTSFPIDDAAIVSNLKNLKLDPKRPNLNQDAGYQLDTTVDRGSRTIGFKLSDACGHLMARYGRTALTADTWYHVAGVYDAKAQTLDVYLNGEPDNGYLAGAVTSRQRSTRGNLYVGSRGDRVDSTDYKFAGSIDDVRIYSLALTREEMAADMQGTMLNGPKGRLSNTTSAIRSGFSLSREQGEPNAACAVSSEIENARVLGTAAAVGVLVAVACVGLWPSASPFLCGFVSFAAGIFLLAAMFFTLPALARWMIPFLSFAGGISVATSIRHQTEPNH
jgi:glycopeptide antibiotics resistance protein